MVASLVLKAKCVLKVAPDWTKQLGSRMQCSKAIQTQYINFQVRNLVSASAIKANRARPASGVTHRHVTHEGQVLGESDTKQLDTLFTAALSCSGTSMLLTSEA